MYCTYGTCVRTYGTYVKTVKDLQKIFVWESMNVDELPTGITLPGTLIEYNTVRASKMNHGEAPWTVPVVEE